jgi:hypothetical protein
MEHERAGEFNLNPMYRASKPKVTEFFDFLNKLD